MLEILAMVLKYWKYALAGALIVTAGAYGDLHGHQVVQAKWDVEKAAIASANTTRSIKDANVADQVDRQYVNNVHTIHDQAKQIIVKVPVYVTEKDDAACTVNNGFVSLWNDANSMQPPGTPSVDNDSPSGIKLSDVEAQHSIESEYTHTIEEQLKATQAYITGITSK